MGRDVNDEIMVIVVEQSIEMRKACNYFDLRAHAVSRKGFRGVR